MRSFAAVATFALFAGLASALPSDKHSYRDVAAHARLARSLAQRAPEPVPVPEPVAAPAVASPEKKKKRDLSKRCKKPAAAHKGGNSQTSTSTSSSSSASPSPTDNGNDNGNNGNNNNNNGNNNGNSGNSGNSGSSGSSPAPASGLTTAPSYCGGPAADGNSPNGQEWYLNCGMNSGGWAPPYVTLDQLTYVKLRDAVNSGSGVFDPCSSYVDTFEQIAASTGVPDIFLASFAMQESTCNPNAVGPNGEQGLMQLTVDKCGGAPDGNCQDVWFNINTGANYILNTISGAGGNVIQAVGQYNGYSLGQTISSVISNPNCGAQQNLDYLNEFFNYWLNNRNPEGSGAAQYNNQQLCNSGELWKINVSA